MAETRASTSVYTHTHTHTHTLFFLSTTIKAQSQRQVFKRFLRHPTFFRTDVSIFMTNAAPRGYCALDKNSLWKLADQSSTLWASATLFGGVTCTCVRACRRCVLKLYRLLGGVEPFGARVARRWGRGSNSEGGVGAQRGCHCSLPYCCMRA